MRKRNYPKESSPTLLIRKNNDKKNLSTYNWHVLLKKDIFLVILKALKSQ